MSDSATGEASAGEVLIVDDAPANLQLLHGILSAAGYGVRIAASGMLALDAVRGRVPDLIILDVRMPMMSGFEVCRRLKEDERARNVPVIFVSAVEDVVDKVHGFSLGGADYITKPFEADEILARVRIHLALHRTRASLEAVNDELEGLNAELEVRVRRRTAELELAHDGLRQSEERYRQMFSTVPDAIMLVDVETKKFIDANDSALGLFGYARSEFLQLGPQDVSAEPREWELAVTDALDHGLDRVPLHRHRRKDGTVFLAEISTSILTLNDRKVFCAVVRDITERNRTEERLQRSEALLRAAGRLAKVGGWEFDTVTREMRWTRETYQIHGVPLDFQPSLDSAIQFFHPDDRPEVTDAIGRAVESGEPHDLEVRFITAQGTRLWIHMMVEPQVVDGVTRMLHGALQDVTERRALEETLRHAQKMEVVGQLASRIAHEFNNLLVGILGNAELLLVTLGKDPPRTFIQPLNDIRRSAERAAATIQQLLSFSRKKSSSVTQVDVNRVVTYTEPMIRRLAGERIELVTELAAELPPVRADEAEIEQIIMNLATNACDAMPQGGTLTIATKLVSVDVVQAEAIAAGARPGTYVQLLVADNGCGMSADTLERIFEPFFSTKPVGQGTGLGLATVRANAARSGGYVTVRSDPSGGTTIHVHLPRSQGAAAATRGADRRADRGSTSGSETILVCDDDEIVLVSTSCLLESAGYTVMRALSPREALQAAAEHAGTISLLLTDVTMPEMNGRELADALQRQRPDLKVIFTSGHAGDVLQAGGTEGRRAAFLKKPSPCDVLFRLVREVLDAANEHAADGERRRQAPDMPR
ncbi:MAG: response regulator [Planctomycetes bacterium]|nr:response regulator [Planctomycetota bacterium]